MQLLCLQTCFVFGLRTRSGSRLTIPYDEDKVNAILEQTSASTDFRSLVDVLDAGPKTRGTERKMYKFFDGTEGEFYRCVLKAIANDPPKLSFDYENLLKRTAELCAGETPVGSSVTGTCLHMSRLAVEKFPSERAIDWDEQKQIVDIPDPYLLFYLRSSWSAGGSELDGAATRALRAALRPTTNAGRRRCRACWSSDCLPSGNYEPRDL